MTVTIYNDLAFDDGRPASGLVVEFSAVGQVFDTADTGELVGPRKVTLDGNGHWAVPFPTQSVLQPGGSLYEVVEPLPGDRRVTRFAVPATGGPYSLASVAV